MSHIVPPTFVPVGYFPFFERLVHSKLDVEFAIENMLSMGILAAAGVALLCNLLMARRQLRKAMAKRPSGSWK